MSFPPRVGPQEHQSQPILRWLACRTAEDFKRLAREIGADADNKGDEVMKRLAKQERKTANKRKPR